jgi:hypothetical protein
MKKTPSGMHSSSMQKFLLGMQNLFLRQAKLIFVFSEDFYMTQSIFFVETNCPEFPDSNYVQFKMLFCSQRKHAKKLCFSSAIDVE